MKPNAEINKRAKVIFHRCAHGNSSMPDIHTYEGFVDDALFAFVFQTLGYSILIEDANGNLREM